jgi:uncharacterized repeat protein (TIGR01451 family)
MLVSQRMRLWMAFIVRHLRKFEALERLLLPRRQHFVKRFALPQLEVLEDHTLLTAAANLQVVQTAAAAVQAGNNLTYTISVTNAGPSAAQNVTLSDTLPSGTTLAGQNQVSGPTLTLSSNGNAVADSLANLLAGQSLVLDVTAAVSSGVANNTLLYNTATAGSSTTNPIPSTSSDTVATAVQNLAALGVSLTGPATAAAGSTQTYTLTVGNSGPTAAQDLSLTDALPSGLTLLNQPFQGGRGSRQVLDSQGDRIFSRDDSHAPGLWRIILSTCRERSCVLSVIAYTRRASSCCIRTYVQHGPCQDEIRQSPVIDNPQPLQALTGVTGILHPRQHFLEVRRLMITRIGYVHQSR